MEFGFHIGVPQAIWLGLMTFAVIADVCRHGKPRTGNHEAVSTVIAAIVGASLLYCGGFFS